MRLEFGDALLQRFHDAWIIQGFKAVHEPVDLNVERARLLFEALAFRLILRAHLYPDIAEHAAGEGDHLTGGLQTVEQFGEVALQPVALDAFAVRAAALCEAHIVRVLDAAPARGEAGGHGIVTVRTRHKPAQGKRLIDVGAHRRIGAGFEPLLRFQKGLIADQAFMLALPKGDAPVWPRHHAGIEHAGEDAVGGFVRDLAILLI